VEPGEMTVVEGLVFYAVHAASKESRRLVLSRTSFYVLKYKK
jgi:hypothetical protein